MELIKVSLEKTQAFNSFFLDYIHQKEALSPFYHRYPFTFNFLEQIKEKQQSFQKDTRNTLVAALRKQYNGLAISSSVDRNIDLLQEEITFTITTGHQLNIFTGPLYFIYKITTVINTCKILKAQHPQFNFVPVYWMASEDHDYEEIKSFNLYGKKYTWETQQQGAVGRFSTQGFDTLLNEIPGDTTIFKNAYLINSKLSDATRFYVNELFGSEGLIVIDGDSRELKSSFINVVKDDLTNHAAKEIIENTNQRLENLHYKTQVHARDINFFYLDDQKRERIEKKANIYTTIDSNISFTYDEIIREVEQYPEKFSPNVVLRPLYQEMILPNLAYVGGPAEICYWLQLKDMFSRYLVPFPILTPRNFALVVEPHIAKKIDKVKLSVSDLFDDKHNLHNQWIKNNTTYTLSTEKEKEAINKVFKALQQQAESIDVTLGPSTAALHKRTIQYIERLEKKMMRAAKRTHEEKLKHINSIKDALFPRGNLQERTDNFLNFYQSDPGFIGKLLDCFDPFDFNFNILINR